jgi:phage gpG-like protein
MTENSRSVTIEFDASGITKELHKLARKAKNVGSVNQQLAEILHLMVMDKFEDEGPGWPDLSDSTLRSRRYSQSPKMLQDTADMITSILPDSGPEYAEVFTNKEYARYHLEGEGVPQRDFFAIDIDKALQTMTEILLEEIGGQR